MAYDYGMELPEDELPLLEDDPNSATNLLNPLVGNLGSGPAPSVDEPTVITEPIDAGGQAPVPAPTTITGNTDGYMTPAWMPSSYGNVLSGYDQAKWLDANHITPKYVVGRILSNYNLQDEAQRNQAIADIQRAYPGVTFDGRDTINFPGIGPVDIFGGASTGEYRPQWLDQTQSAAQTSGTQAASQPSILSSLIGSSQQQHTSSTTPTTSAVAPAGVQGSDTIQQAYRDALMALLGTPQTVDAQSLYSSPEAAAFRLSAQRAEERQRAQLAEDAGYRGTSNLEGRQRQLAESRGESEAQFVGQLALQRMQDQRDRLFMGLQLAQQTGQFDEAQRLARDLASLDAAISREGISAQSSLGFANLANTRQMANNQLGFNYAALEAELNRQALLAMLGG